MSCCMNAEICDAFNDSDCMPAADKGNAKRGGDAVEDVLDDAGDPCSTNMRRGAGDTEAAAAATEMLSGELYCADE